MTALLCPMESYEASRIRCVCMYVTECKYITYFKFSLLDAYLLLKKIGTFRQIPYNIQHYPFFFYKYVHQKARKCLITNKNKKIPIIYKVNTDFPDVIN